MDMIQFKDVCYEYPSYENKNAKQALSNVSFTIQKGEFVAVMGHNGSGKSTLAKLINALLIPTSGCVTVNGYDTGKEENIYKVRTLAGMVFQNPDNQIIASVVEEDVAFGPENLGLLSDVIKTRVDSALKSVSMEQLSDKPTNTLSGGQKQKLAIAGVLAMEPAIIVLDEPTAMLDGRGVKDVLKTVKTLNRDNCITVVFITHEASEAVLFDRVIVMENGRIVMDAPPAEVFKDRGVIEALGLTMPPIADLNIKLRAMGFDLPQGLLTVREMTDELCRLKQRI